LILVGRDGDRAAVRALWDWLLRRVEWLSATAGPGRSRKWHEAFRVGVVDAVAARLDDRAPVDVGGALVAVDAAVAARAAAVDRFVSENLGLSRGRGMRVDAGAYAAGQRAGQDLSLPGR
jgi:hypothetical protein